jgi:hypothetical protein
MPTTLGSTLGLEATRTALCGDWIQAKNEQFIACAAADKLGATANPPILIAPGWDNIPAEAVTFRDVEVGAAPGA